MTQSLARRMLLPTLALIAFAVAPHLQGFTVIGHRWGTNSVPYYVNPQSMHVSPSAVISAVQTAAAGWSEQSLANIHLIYAGTTNGSSLTLNGKNEVFLRGANGGNVGEAYSWWDANGDLIDGDIVLYEGANTFFAGSGCWGNGIYVENVTIHEFGHVLGLGHSSLPGVTMAPSMSSYCDRTQLTLEADDVAGIEVLYPPLGGGVRNTAPLVSVITPLNGSSYSEGASIAFSGSALDSQDGDLAATLRWTSNLVGEVGTGGSFSRILPVGTHVITASATDNGGMWGSSQVTVTVKAWAPVSVPGQPTVTSAAPSGGSLVVSWLAGAGPAPTSHRLDFYAGATLVATVNAGAGPTIAIPIPAGTQGAFGVQITAISGAGTGPASALFTFNIGRGCTVASPDVSGRVVGGTASVSWPAVAGATSYILSAGAAPGRIEYLRPTSLGTSTGASASGLAAGFTAWVRVIAVSACGQQSAPRDFFVQ